MGFTAFFIPIVSEFGWSYATVSLATSLRGVEVGILAPIVGLLIDRHGPRWIMFCGIVIIGLGLLLLSHTDSLALFYGAFVLISVGMCGLSPTLLMTAVANWFRKKVGTAIGIMSSGFACGGLLVPIVVTLIDLNGWRLAAVILCLTLWIIGLPLALILRHKPEKYGYLPDGDKNTAITASETPSEEVRIGRDVTAKQAIKDRAFWFISIGTGLNYFAISAVIIHIMPYLNSIGIDRSDAGFIAMGLPLVSIIGRIGAGWLGDRLNKVKIASTFMVFSCTGMLLLSYAQVIDIWFILLFVIFYGIGWGGTGTIRASLLREYFGRNSFGVILGFNMGITAVTVIVGPFIAGAVFDTYNSYQPAWLLYAGLIFIAAIIMFNTPRKKSNS